MRKVSLGEVATITMGQAPPGTSYNDDGLGVPLVAGAGDFRNGQLKPTKYTTSPTKLSAPGDIILSIRASIGAKVWADGTYCLGRGVAGLRPSEGLAPKYLWHWLTHYERQLVAKGRGATFLQVNRSDIGELPISLPSTAEQRRIAAILDQADSLRTERRRSLGLLDDLARSLFDAEFGDASEATLRPLGQLAEVVSGLTKGRKLGDQITHAVPYLAVANVQSGHLRLDTVKEIEATETEIERYRLQPGDLVMTEGGDPDKLGRGTLWQDELPLCLHQNHIFRVRLRSGSGVEPRYLAAYIAGQAARSYFLRSAKQTTGIASINMTQLRGLPVVVPSLQSQRRFIGYLEQAALTRKSLQDAAREAEALFASLQSQAFSGELAHATS